MTIKLPQKTIADKFLKLFGKKRGIILPADENPSIGHTVHLKARWENFWIVLFRSKNKHLPANVFDPDDIK